MNTTTHTRSALFMFALSIVAALFMLIPLTSEAHGGTGKNASSTKPGNNVDASCMAEAVDDREDALLLAWEEMSSSTMEALEDRRDALMAAWNKPTVKERTLAVTKAWKEWRAERKDINAEFRKDRKAAWDAFKKTAKEECKTALPKDESQEKAASDTIAL